VKITVLTGLGPHFRRTIARRGAFRLTLRLPTVGCGAAYSARAVGDRGSTASVVFARAPVCVPPPRE
jgi:hypothetical protein